MSIDPWLNLRDAPPFLAQTGGRDREFWRVAAFAPLWIVAGLIIGFMTFFTATSLGDKLVELTPAPVHAIVAAPLARVRPEQVSGDLGLVGEARRVLSLSAGPAAFAIAVPLVGWLLMRRAARSWYTSKLRFRWRMLAAGLVLFCLATGVAMVLDGLINGFPKSSPLLRADESVAARMVYFLVTLGALTAAAAAEEVVTRGWLMQQTAVFTHNLVLILGVNAFAFMVVHLDPDPARNAALFLSGLSLSLIAVRTGGLEFGIGVHAANNLMLAWFSEPFRVTDLGGRMSAADLAVQAAVTLSGLALAELTLRWRPLREAAGLSP